MQSFASQVIQFAVAGTVAVITIAALLLWRVYVEVGRDLPVVRVRHSHHAH